MKALITGTSGFAGKHLASELAGADYEVLGIDLHEHSGLPFEHRVCDLLDAEAVGALVREYSPGAVFHLAAQSSAARSFKDPRATFEINILGTLNLLSALKDAGSEAKVLLAGSAEEYGRRLPEEMPLSEESPIEPVSPYAASKAAQNLLGMQFFRAFGSRIVLTRSFNHTGPGQTDTFVLPSFARQCAGISRGDSEPVLRTGNTGVVRDFLDVRDVARAYRLLIEKGIEGETYNICSGEGLKLSYALEKLTFFCGKDVRTETDPDLARPADVPVLIGDNSKLREATGWAPEIGTDMMLADLYEWWLRAGA